MTSKPFVVLAVPRSRTYWLSKFLTYGDYECGHEQILGLRSMADLKSWKAQGFVGSAETAGASWWRLLDGVNIVTVRRPVKECVDSMLAVDMKGVCGFERETLTKRFEQIDAKLTQIEHRMPNVLSVQFADLANEETCARVFEHCLPYPHDSERWQWMKDRHLECSMPAIIRYYQAHLPQINKMTAVAKQAIMRDLTRNGPVALDGMVFAQETYDQVFHTAHHLFNEHLANTDQAPGDQFKKNLPLFQALSKLGMLQITTARSNGRMFGYLMTVIAPSLDAEGVTMAENAMFFASPDAPGLGMRLQRASIEALRARGVQEVQLRAGIRGSGPRLGTIYRRLGAEHFGELYRLKLGVE